MALALNNLKRVDMPLNKETKPIIRRKSYLSAEKQSVYSAASVSWATLLDKENFKLPDTIFSHSHYGWLCIFVSVKINTRHYFWSTHIYSSR